MLKPAEVAALIRRLEAAAAKSQRNPNFGPQGRNARLREAYKVRKREINPWKGYDMIELETAQQRIAELGARVQELGQMARDVGSRRVVELESELAAMRAGGGLTKWRLQHHPDEMPDGEVVDYPLLPGDFADGWTEQPLCAHPSPPDGMVMVPKMPTNAMTSAGANAVEDPENERSSWDLAENMWRAMIEAAPALKQGAAIAAGAPSIEDLCARIKAADDAAADCDYMLDSNDCIAVLRGEWKGPLAMDKPDLPSSGQAPAGVMEDAARYRWLREGNDAKHGAAWHVAVNLYGCEWDAAIDAARKQGGA